ncbi:MAG: DinB family protein [Bacteroidia bacterium]|nr:DinB family protein [Bacteroidia bacterium]
MLIPKPALHSVPPYYVHYINLIPETDLITAFNNSTANTLALISSIHSTKENHAYSPNKWTIKQVFNHIIDTERILAYRAFRFSRKDATALAPFNENDYATNDNSNTKTLANLITEYTTVRASTHSLYSHITTDMLNFEGNANNLTVTAQSIGWFIIGHNTHHCNVLQERYLV